MKTLVFASNNAHKLEEIRSILGEKFEVKSLKDIGCDVDIPETGSTFKENALQKAQYVKEHFGLDCFADDSGLEVEALGGEPGVYSARYAMKNGVPVGGNKDEANMDVLLGKLVNEENRKARFCTCVALVYEVALSKERSFVRNEVMAGLDMTPFSCPMAMTRLLPNWAMR